MRRFSAEYLRRTRAGMWTDSREALADLDLAGRERVLDVGCGTGELTHVLAEEATATTGTETGTGAETEAGTGMGTGSDSGESAGGPTADGTAVVGIDADPDLLAVAAEETGLPTVAGDATRLPVGDGAFDLVVCQALLVNLPDPGAAVSEFARASSDLVAAVEPDNADVGVESTVEAEVILERRVRDAYLEGVGTDVALGERTAELFREAGLTDVRTRRYYHEKRIEPPYDESEVTGAARKASGAALADHGTELRRALPGEEYDDLRAAWREMGREVVAEMRAGEYRRVEVVPFDVTVGRVTEET